MGLLEHWVNLSSDDSDELTMQLAVARRATNEEVQDKKAES
jgi:hypothetical protein